MTELAALAALLIAAYYIYLLSRHFRLGLISLLAVDLYYFTFGLNNRIIGGIHLDPHDGIVMCLLAAGCIRTAKRMNNLNSIRIVGLAYVALLAISVGRGLFSNGILNTLNETRSFAASMLAVLYFLTAPTDEDSIRWYIRIYLYFGAALCVVAALAAAGLPVGMGASAHITAESVNGRYLPAAGAGVVAVCGFLSLADLWYRRVGLWAQLLPIMFMSVAIYLRHRTVWMMLLAGVTALLPLDGRLFRRILPAILVAAVAVAGLAVYGNTAVGLPGEGAFSKSATDTETWDWRVNGWLSFLESSDQTALTFTFGQNMGSGYYHYEVKGNAFVNVEPHDETMEQFLRVGAVGALFIFLFTFIPLVKLWKLSRVDMMAVYPSASTWAIVLVIALAFGVTYSIEEHIYLLIGIAGAIALHLDAPQEADPPLEFEEWNTENTPNAAD